MLREYLILAVFLLSYILFALFPRKRSWVAVCGSLALAISGAVTPREAFFELVNWNVMGLFWGTLVLAELFMLSKAPAMMAESLIARTRTGRGAMLALCGLAGALSIAVENVAVVLLFAPVAFSLSERLKMNPTPLLVGMAVCANIQGTATMIGDPPSMILAGYMKMGFLDFFIYEGRPGIFFAIELGAVAALAVLAWVFRRHGEPSSPIEVEHPRSWLPTALLGLLVIGLSFSTLVDPAFRWFASSYSMVLAATAMVWLAAQARWIPLSSFVRCLDWDTTIFLAGVFILVGALGNSGWLQRIADAIAGLPGAGPAGLFILLTAVSLILSGFVDNVPFLMAMIPVSRQVAEKTATPVPLLMFGLLVGACLGGNLTPIGASANVVVSGLLRRRGHPLTFAAFGKFALPATLAALALSASFVWLIWSK